MSKTRGSFSPSEKLKIAKEAYYKKMVFNEKLLISNIRID